MTTTYPYQQVKCPYTNELFTVREQTKVRYVDGVPQRLQWVYEGNLFDTLDDVLEYRRIKAEGVTVSRRETDGEDGGPKRRRSKGRRGRKQRPPRNR